MMKANEYFAVIDTETTWTNVVMSVGIVIARRDTCEIIDKKYLVMSPECEIGGMYDGALFLPGIESPMMGTRQQVIACIESMLDRYSIRTILAYNASFDKNHLPELGRYTWCDIMRLAAYRQFNHKIPSTAECCGTGRLKRGYGVEDMTRLLANNPRYHETHNAYFDTMDELNIVKMLGYPLDTYLQKARI